MARLKPVYSLLTLAVLCLSAACFFTDDATELTGSAGGSTVGSTANPTSGETSDGYDSGGVCGDGIIQGGEQCDDGNDVPNDGCTNACATPACGDGIVQVGEQCDDGNDVPTDACASGCKNAACGDGSEGLRLDVGCSPRLWHEAISRRLSQSFSLAGS